MGLLVYGLNYLVGTIGSILVTIAANLVNFALDLNNQILQNKTLEIGWTITRDLANLGFVLVIILIAFATILRIETHAMKSILWRLIVAALLVNFSLVIAGVFINFSGSLTDFFIKKATGDKPMELSLALADSLQVQKLLQPSEDENVISKAGRIIDIATFGPRSVMIIVSMFFVAVFTVTAAIVLGGLAYMFLLRYLWLVILLILMPLAWVAWIWPGLNNLWGKWWSNFFKWIWFAPVASFFVYLALTIATSKKVGGFETFSKNLSSLNYLTIENFGGIIGQMILVVGLLVGGLIAAESMGIAGAAATMKFAAGARNMILGGTQKIGGRIVPGWRGALTGALGDRLKTLGYKPPDKEGKGGGGIISRTAQKFTGTPLVGGAARAVSGWAVSANKVQIENYGKRLEKLANDKTAFLNYMKSLKRPFTNPAEIGAYLKTAADKGLLNDLKKDDKDGFEYLFKEAKKVGIEKEITAKMPTAAAIGKTGAEAKDAIAKVMLKVKPADVANFMPEEFYKLYDASKFNSASDQEKQEALENSKTILFNLTRQHLTKLATEASPQQRNAINAGITKLKESSLTDKEKDVLENLENWETNNIAMQRWETPKKTKPKIITENLEEEFKKRDISPPSQN